MRDLSNNIHLQPAFPPKAAVTDNTAQVSSTCDKLGYDSVTLAYILGTNADADMTYTLLVEDSTTGSGSWVAVDDEFLIGTEVLGSADFNDDNECRKIGYVGPKRYVRATLTPANNTGNVFIGGVWILGHPNRAPTANPPS